MKKLSRILVFLFLCIIITSSNIKLNQTKTIETKSNQSYTLNVNSKLKNIVVFIEFSDGDTNVRNRLDDEQSVENAYKIFNSDELFEMNTIYGIINVPSFKKYFERESYGNLSIISEIFPKENGTVVSYKDSHPIGYYLKYNEQNQIGYKNQDEVLQRETELLDNAISYISDMVASSGITANEIDTDNNGIIDAITFILEGQPNLPSSISWRDLLWSHKSDNTNLKSTILNKKVSSYTLLYAEDYTEAAGLFSLNRGNYGTIIHEFGHILGYMDLYRYNSQSKPVGFYDIMGNVIGSQPQSFLTYYISEYTPWTSWHTPLPVIDKTTTNITVHKPKFIDRNETRAVKLVTNQTDKEFFVVEYHNKLNTYETHSADESGIIIYRVNENNKFNGNTDGSNQGIYDHVYIFRPNETGLGEGNGSLRTATLNLNRPHFGSDIKEDKTFDNKSIFYSDGTNSGIKIEVTSQTDETITFNVTFPETNGAGTKEDPYIINDTTSFLYHMSLNTTNKYYKITENLDFKDINNYPKINFNGNLDGNNKTISNIKTNNSGIFDNINISNFNNQTTIENLNFENVTVHSSKGDYLGGLASTATNVNLKNIHLISGTVTNEGDLLHDTISTGGFIGNVNNTVYIENCYSNLNVTASKNVGGFIGLNMNSIIKNSFSTGKLSGSTIGGFIALQLITDNTYNTPVNVYYKSDNIMSGVGGYDKYLHNLNVLNESSLSNGIRSVYIPDEITLQKNESRDIPLKITPNVTLSMNISVENQTIIDYENNKIIGCTPGSSNLYIDLNIGNNKMRLTTKVTVKKEDEPITETEALNFLGLTKKENYITGFPLETKISDIINKINSNQKIILKSIKNSEGKQITSGIISTGIKINLVINNQEYNYTVVVKGDVNGDGYIYATDYVKVKNHIMGKNILTGSYLEAADINNDNNIYATDYVQIKNHIMGKKPLEQSLK